MTKLEIYQQALEQIAALKSATQSRGALEQFDTPDPLIDSDGWGPIRPQFKEGLEFAARIAERALQEAEDAA